MKFKIQIAEWKCRLIPIYDSEQPAILVPAHLKICSHNISLSNPHCEIQIKKYSRFRRGICGTLNQHIPGQHTDRHQGAEATGC